MAFRLFDLTGPLEGTGLPIRVADPVVTLEGLVLASLLCDARDNDQADPRGFWGDAYTADGDRFGSRLWAIPPIVTDANLRANEQAAEEALAWMVTDGLAKSVAVVATVDDDGRMRFEITIDESTITVLGGP